MLGNSMNQTSDQCCTHDCNQGRTCPARAAVLQELENYVKQEMARVCNEYAKRGNMIAATAVDDAWLCVQSHLARVAKMLKGERDD